VQADGRIVDAIGVRAKEQAMHGADWNLYILLAVFWIAFVLWRAGSR